MKSFFFHIIICISFLSGFAQDIVLIEPQKTGGLPLMETLAKRETNRNFTQDTLTNQQLSNLLWAAVGINRPNGKRTAPTARNAQEIDLYVFMEKGVYYYDPQSHTLKQLVSEDKRALALKQEGFTDCPVVLLFVANYDKMEKFAESDREFYGAVDAGYISQNVYLFCASEGLVTCAIGMIHRPQIKELLQINGKAILAQIVGVKEQ